MRKIDILLLLHLSAITTICYSVDQWDLPVFPIAQYPSVPTHIKFNRPNSTEMQVDAQEYRKKVPRYLWIAVKDAKDKTAEGLNYQMVPLFKRNPMWEVHISGKYQIFDNLSKTLFGNEDTF